MEPPDHDEHLSKHVRTRKREDDPAPLLKLSYSSVVTRTTQATAAAAASTANLPPRDRDAGVMTGQKTTNNTANGNTTVTTSNGYGPWMLFQINPNVLTSLARCRWDDKR
ncbi:hypothetical protein K2173_022970 [Erythroxylum novogranatense]|uniref:Uncharacterized protein n=1 Tax=Erythroxylum novogranatense TaxID=1862640 RepID=A0AAV8T8Y7_9ROSI|nr:hypothetical protein K2173_022970 [Erythroxylum novogranatense]